MTLLEKYSAPVGTTLDRFISQKQEQFPFASGELSQLLRDIALAGKIINREINRAGLTEIESSIGSQNIQGEHQLMLDVIADTRFHRALTRGGQTCGIISEEREDISTTPNLNAKYVVAIDPLDGSSNVDVNVSIGTIFSIYRRKSAVGTEVAMEDMLQLGTEQVGAGYILYGSSTMLVYSTGHGVNGFTYEPSLGEFFLSHPNIKIKDKSYCYSVNEGYFRKFDKGVQQYIDLCKDRGCTARYIGSLVADFHRNLLKGGIYLYPKTTDHPEGKLRLLYECNALAFLVEQAGGIATDGKSRILDLVPSHLHQRTPLFIGSKPMVEEAMELYNKAEAMV